MDFKKFGSCYVLRIDRGEEIVATLKKFAGEQNIKLGSLSGIGAADKITIGLFNSKEKKFYKQELTGDYEITNLSGNISTMNNETYLHLHITISDDSLNAKAGHLVEAVVSGTCEIFIEAIDGKIDRKFSEDAGLNLINF